MSNVFTAIYRARLSILAVAVVYAVALIVGILMVHLGSTYALSARDRLVDQAAQQDPSAQAASQGKNTQAALLDFSSNLFMGALPKTVMGFGVIFPFPWVAYQGWVGGIVSVRDDHTSRFDDPRSAVYYLLTLLLQLLTYSLAVGAGINVGVALWRPAIYYQGKKWLYFFPKEALVDLARIYLLVVPLFFVASMWEFLSLWNI